MIFLSAAVAFFVMVARLLLDWLFLWQRTDCSLPSTRLLIPLSSTGGVVAAFAVYGVLRLQKDRAFIRSELNHEIRNALQPMLYRAEFIADPELEGYVRESIRRIEAALVNNLGAPANRDSDIGAVSFRSIE